MFASTVCAWLESLKRWHNREISSEVSTVLLLCLGKDEWHRIYILYLAEYKKSGVDKRLIEDLSANILAKDVDDK